jgi:tetratricopeptide (TPR) repeat protein
MSRVIAEAVRGNPRCGEFFAAFAAALDRLRRYPDAARGYEEARRRMPQLVAVPGQLGMVWMRLGEEARAAELLEESNRIDPFNARVKNTLEVLDLLRGYGTLETDHFVIRYDPARDSLLAKYAARHLEEIYPEITGRLGFRPPSKSLFEIFSSARGTSGQGWFAARMAGLPFIGTVAGCAGKIVGMVSPGDTRDGFGWASVLRHEFVHVVNLQQTGFAIPHWYTEGLAVYHEDTPRPPEWDEILARRAAAGKLFTLDNLNFGFLRPSGGEDWPLAYCQAELYAEYMVRTWGATALNKMIAAYADHLDTPRALARSFGVKPENFEAGYRKYVEGIVAGGKPEAREARKALEAEVAGHEAARDTAKLTEALVRLTGLDENEAAPRERLARLAIARNDRAAAAEWAKRTLHVDVKNAEAHAILAETLAAAGSLERAVEEYEAALLFGPRRQPLLMGLARACAGTKRDACAREALRDLLEADPEYPGARELLGTLR